MIPNWLSILLINNGRILAEGNIHQIRELIDKHPHTVHVRAADPRRLARLFARQHPAGEGVVHHRAHAQFAAHGQILLLDAARQQVVHRLRHRGRLPATGIRQP